MSDNAFSGPLRANSFHSGSTCPFCQESIEEGILIIKCNKCESVHHESCWQHSNGCSSYHCDEKVTAEAMSLEPELVITVAETQNAVPIPTKPVKGSPEKTAKKYLPAKPTHISKLSVFALVLALSSLTGVVGFVTEEMILLATGIGIAILAITIGVISMVIINNSRKVYGYTPATFGIFLSATMVIVYFTGLNSFSAFQKNSNAVDLKMAQRMPNEADLDRMDPWKANALRTNVVVKCDFSVFGGATYGSGIIMKIHNQKAFILTNKHVIANSPNIHILFYNGEESDASIEWQAPGDIDVAVISCQALTLNRVKSTQVEPAIIGQGKKVFAVGNPMNLYWTYTEGVISGIRYRHQNDRDIVIYQTQTPINSGNSGGGLYDMNGHLIGVNTWTKDKSIAEGLNFAISVKSILDLLGEEKRRKFLE